MPRTYARFQGIKLRTDWTKKLDERFQITLRKGARAYLKALITRVPVWTGMARGSIKFARGPNGFLAAYLNVAIPIVPHPKAEFQVGKNQHAGGPYGSYNFTSGRHVYQFKFRSDVVHYIMNEFFARPPKVKQQIKAPWHSQEAGVAAFKRTVQMEMDATPDVRKWLFNEVMITKNA